MEVEAPLSLLGALKGVSQGGSVPPAPLISAAN